MYLNSPSEMALLQLKVNMAITKLKTVFPSSNSNSITITHSQETSKIFPD
jgi:hypothetical protein